MQRRASFPSSPVPTETWLAPTEFEEDSCSASLPSHLRRFPLKYKNWPASAESINPKRDRLVESHLSTNERWAAPPHLNRQNAELQLSRDAHTFTMLYADDRVIPALGIFVRPGRQLK